MTVQEAETQLDRLEKARGVVLTNRTRHMILRAVAAGVTTVGFHGLDADLSTNVGIAVAAGLLHFHPAAWLETIPEVFASPMPLEVLVEKPKFGL
jgi:hypothetical protein